jgi:hypothetical protein
MPIDAIPFLTGPLLERQCRSGATEAPRRSHMSCLIALIIALAFAVTAGVGPALAQPKAPAAKSDKASATKKAPPDINSASEDDLKTPAGYR